MTERKTRTTAPEPKPDVAPIGRFYDLQREVPLPEPYVLTEDIVITPLTKRQFKAIQEATDEEAIGRISLGDHYDAIEALYDDRPLGEWQAFLVEVNEYLFGKGVGQAPGKSEESSTS